MAGEARRPAWWSERRPGELVRVERPDSGGAWAVTLFVATGTRPGPTLAVLGAVHGDEYEGPVAFARLLAELAPADLAGTLIAVPVANPPAFAADSRTSPLDGLNLARCFPGDPAGTASQCLAALLAEEVSGVADALLDLHSAGVAYEMALLVGYCHLGPGDRTGGRSRELALAFGAPVLWEHPETAPGRTLSVALNRGIPSLYTEAVGGGGAPERVVRCYVEGVRRVLTALGMLPGPLPQPRHEQVWRGAGNTDQALAARTAGLFRSVVGIGDAVGAADTLGEIVAYDGRVVERIVAPEAGIVAMVRRIPRVSAGDGLYLLTSHVADEAGTAAPAG